MWYGHVMRCLGGTEQEESCEQVSRPGIWNRGRLQLLVWSEHICWAGPQSLLDPDRTRTHLTLPAHCPSGGFGQWNFGTLWPLWKVEGSVHVLLNLTE